MPVALLPAPATGLPFSSIEPHQSLATRSQHVSTPTSDNTSSYTFSSTEAGTITYGVCSGSPDNASAGNNTITFDALADGTHSNCKISVTDNASNTSDNLSVSSFTIGATKPALVRGHGSTHTNQ